MAARPPLLTWASEFLDENNALIPVLASVATGVAAYAAAVSVLTILPKITAFLKSFNTTLLTNPYVLAAAAVATLTAAVVQYAASLEGLPEETQTLIDSVAETAERYEQITGEIADASAANKAYAKSIFDLSAQQRRSSADQALLLEQINRLNEAVPGLNLAWDETTQSLNMTEEAVNSFLETQSGYGKYEAAVQAYADAQYDSIQIAEQLAAAQEELEAIEAKGNATTISGMQGREAMTDEYRAAKNAVDELTAAQDQNNAVMESTKTVIDEYTQGATAYAMATEGKTIPVTDKFSAKLREFTKRYNELRASAEESLSQQISQWQQMDNQLKISAQELNERLLSQITYLQNYTTNLDSLRDRNIEGIDILVDALSDGSTESAAILAGLAEETDETIGEIVSNMNRRDEMKEAAANSMAGLTDGFAAELYNATKAAEEVKNATIGAISGENSYYTIGSNDIKGYIRGMESQIPAVASIASRVSRAGQSAFKATAQQKSPSKAYEKIADYDVQGYIKGWEKKRKAVLDEIKFQGETNLRAMQARFPTHEAIQAGFRAAENNRASQIQSGLSAGNGELAALLTSVNGKLDRMLAGSDSLPSYKIYLDDQVLAGHLAPAMDDAIGAVNRLKERGI